MLKVICALLELAAGDLALGHNLVSLKLIGKVDNRAEQTPQIKLYIDSLSAVITGSTYGILSMSEMTNEEAEVVSAACIKRDWHTWVGVVQAVGDEPKEWWPSVCKRPTKSKPEAPVQYHVNTDAIIFMMPMAAMSESRATNGSFVIRTDLEAYEKGRNMVCAANHHFHTQYFPALREGSPPPFDDGVVRRPVEEMAIPDGIRELFANEIDPCTLIQHPCWCDRAPSAWKCNSCQLGEEFGGRWFCYGRAFDNHAAWCDAKTVERQKGKPNRPISSAEYAELLVKRAKGSPELFGRDIHWLID